MGAFPVITLLALAASAVAGPLGPSGPCARQCTESSKFLYTPGTSYFFDYESDAITTMQGTTKEESRLHMKARVEIHAVSKCDFAMRLSGVSLEHSDPINVRSKRPASNLEEFRRSLERNTLKFSFQDGNVESICPADGETAQALNIKRGILSALQTSTSSLENPERVIETDVSGKCTVNYEPLGRGWNSVTLRKMKDLSTCTERNNADTAIQMNPFSENQETKSAPLIKGNQECQQVFKQNRLESVICSETHVFRPFSSQDGGAMTKITQALTFSSEKKTSFPNTEFSSMRKAMTFDHEPDVEERDRRTRQVETSFIDLCTTAKDDIRPSVPGKFTTFVYGLRQLENSDLVNLYRRLDRMCPDNDKAKKFFLDGITMAGTPGSIKFIVDMMQNGGMPEREVDLWISTLAFVNKPTKETLVALTPLLDGKRKDVILPISAVVQTFCRQNDECGMKSEVRQIVQKVAQMVGNKCNGEKQMVMLSLKAMGNMGVSFETEEMIQACAQNTKLDTDMRIAAIQAYRRLSCDVMRSPIMDMYTNQEENVEVRIAAFLNIMRCPSEAMMQNVKDTMEAEKIKQVGSFVMSYLKNIEKQSAYKTEIRDIVSKVEYLNKFESDIRKYSRNYKNSFFMDSMDSGLAWDSNIIYEPSSYLPRTAMLNLNVDIMGTSVNLFELEGRAEGLEKIVERMFGPEGYFGKDEGRVKKPIADNKIEKYDQKFDLKKNFDKDASLAVDMKMFGNSLWYKKFQSGDEVSEIFSAMDIMVALAKEQEIDLTKSFLFLDTTVHIPTGSGLPLKLAINGSAVMNLKMSGKIEAKSIQNVDVQGKIQPSGAIEICTVMSVNAGIAKTGLKMVATMHTSTSLDGLVEIKGGKLYQARLNVPKDKYEVIDVQSRIFLVNGEEEREQNSVVEQNTVYTECTGKFTSKPMGVELCGEMQLPTVGKKNAPLYPFSGPARLSFFVRKTDATLTSYNIDARWTEDKNGREVVGQHLVMSFNTPQSKIDRELSAEFHLNKQDSTASMKLHVPNKKLAITAKRVMNDNEKRVSVAVSVDDREKFSVSASMLAEEMEGGIRYQPALEIRGPSSRWLNIRSTASVKNLKYSGEVVVEDLTATPVVLNGEVTFGERSRYELMAMAESYAISAKVKGHVQCRNGVSSKINVQYRIMEGRKETLDVTSKIRNLSASGLIKYSGAASLASSAMPEISSTVAWETQITAGHIENSLDLSFGDGKIKRIQKISMSEIIKYQGSMLDNSIEGTIRMTYPDKDIDFALQLNHKNTLESLENTVNLKYAPGREASSSIDLKLKTAPVKLTTDVQLKYPGRELRLQGDVTKKQDNEYDATMTAQWQRGSQIRAVGNFHDGSTRNGRDYQVTLEMTMPNTRPMSLVSQLTAMPGRYVISADGDILSGSYGLKCEYTKPSTMNHRVSAMVKVPKMTYTVEGTLEKNGEAVIGKIDANIPSYRRVTGTFDVSNGAMLKAGVVDLMWDADRDQSKRVQMEAEYRLNADGSQGKFSLKNPIKSISGSYSANYAGQYSSGIMRGNLHTELEWGNNQKMTMDLGGNMALKQSRRQLNGEIKVTTPVNGYDNMMMTVQHTDTWPEWNNKVTVQWKRNRKVILGSEGKFRQDSRSIMCDMSVRLSTPLRGYESLSLREIFEIRPSEISSSSYVQWATGKSIELSMSGAAVGYNGLRAGANLTSPFDALRDLSMTFSNSYSKSNVDTDFDLRWNAHNSVSVNFDGRNIWAGKKHTCSAEFQLLSTIRDYEKMITKVVYNKDTSATSLSGDLRWNENRVTVGLNGENRNTHYGYDMEGKMEYASSFRNFEKGEIKLAHLSSGQKFSCNVESVLPYNNNLVFKLNGNMPSYKEMDSSLSLTSTFIEPVTYQIAYKLEGNRLAANGVAVYGTKKVTGDITGTLQTGYTSWDMDYQVNINTPIREFEDLKLSVSQTRRELKFTTRFQASKNQNRISLNHDIEITDALNFVNNIRVTTPYRGLNNVEVNTKQTGKIGEYKHNTEAMWGNKKASMSMELNNQNQRRGRNFEARLNAKSPFQTLSSLDFEVAHEDDERTFKPRISIQWNEINKMSVESVLSNNRFKKVDARINSKSSFSGYENMVLTGKYDITKSQKTAEMTYRWNERLNKAITVRGALEADSTKGMVDLSATTPVRGLETIQLKTDYAFAGNENSVIVFTQYGDKKYTFNGKHIQNSNGNEISAQVSTPIYGYEKLASFATYAINRKDMSGEVSYEWGSDKKVMVNAEYKYPTGKTIAKVSVVTPFIGYKRMALNVEGNLQNSQKTGSVLIQWDPNQTIQASGAFESDISRFLKTNAEFRSPFEGFKEVTINGDVKRMAGKFDMDAAVQWMQNKVSGKVTMEPRKITVTLDTPFRPYKNVRFVSELNNQFNDALATASLEWDNTNKADISANYKLSEKMIECKIEATIPLNGRQTYSATGSFMNDKLKMMEGRFEVRSPESRYEISSLVRQTDDNKEMTLTLQGPESKISLNGNVLNKKYREIEGNLNLESNIKYIPSSSLQSSYNNDDWKNIRFNAKLNNAHSVTGTYRNNDQVYQIEATVESPMIRSKRFAVDMKANTKDIHNMDGTIAYEIANLRHILTVSEKYTRSGLQAEVKVNSPAIRGQEVNAKIFYNNKKNKDIQAKLSIVENRQSHMYEIRFNNENREMTGKINIECAFVPTGKLDIEGKMARPADNVLETSLTAQTGSSRHSIQANGKILETQMELTVNVDSPNVSPRPVSLTANLNNERFRYVDGSVSYKSVANEARVAFNMKRNGWRDLEAFFTMNLPIESLSMLRVDMKMKNDGLKSMEGSLDIKSSLRAMRMVSLSGKMENTENAWDMSVNCKTPVRNWDSISLLATVHKNKDLSRMSPRITLSIPSRKYVVYANYEKSDSDMQASIGSEWDNSKAELSVEHHPNEFRVVILTPIRGHERYSTVTNYRNDRGRRSAQIVLEDAQTRKYTTDVSFNYNNALNFVGEANVKLPYSGLRDVSAKIRQTWRRGHWSTNLEHNVDRIKKVVLSIEHDVNPISGNIQIQSPIEQIKVIYNLDASKTNGKVEVELSNRNVLRMAVEQDVGKNVIIELPTFPYTLRVSSKPLSGGSELVVKSVLPSRSLSFKTMSQSTSNLFSHGSELVLDDRSGQTFSYEIRTSPTPRRGNELYARLNMPIRSFEMRTTHEKTSTGRTVSADLLWDAVRDPTRHLKVTLEHSDNSNRYNFAHKIRATASHPELSKDIVLSTECLVSPNEIYGKTEVEYSRYQQHNVFLEAGVKNNAQNRREIRYSANLAARHPVTNLDMKVTAELANTQQEMSAEMQFNYLDRNLRKQIQELRTKIQKTKQNIEFMARSNENKINVVGRMFHKDNEFTLAVEQSINDGAPSLSHFRYNQKHKNSELNISTLNGNSFKIRAEMPDDHIEAVVSHTAAGRQYKDGSFYLGLKDNKVLQSRINWRPEAYDETQEILTRAFEMNWPSLGSTISSAQDEISNEVDSKVNSFTRAVMQETKPFVSDMSSEARKMRVDRQRASNEISQMYRRNDFYMRTGSDYLRSAATVIRENYEAAVDYVVRRCEILGEIVSMTADITMNILHEMADDMARIGKNYERMIRKNLVRLSKYAAQLKSDIVDTLATISKNAGKSLADYMNTLSTASRKWIKSYVPRLMQVVEQYSETALRELEVLANWFKDYFGDQLKTITEHQAYRALCEYADRVSVTVLQFRDSISYNDMVKRSRMFMSNGVENLADAYQYVRDHPNVNYVNDVASGAFEQGRHIATEFGINEVIVDVLEELFKKVQKMVWKSVRDMADEYAVVSDNAKLNYEPENGVIEVEFKLPVMRKSLKQLVDISSYPQIQKLRDLVSQMSFGDFCIWDTYYKYKRYMDISYWLPPFKAQAMLVGSQHFITFDNFDFDFAGECSYLLARDFVDGNFTVTVNYARDNERIVKKSLNVYSDGVKIEIGRDSKVTIDDRKVELPQEVGKTAVTIEDGVIAVSRGEGYQVYCNFVHDICMLEVNGFYFGKTGGLFGTNNYEPYYDMMTPDKKIAGSLDEFAESWQVGKSQCVKSRNLADVSPVDRRAKEKCEALFKNYNSEFRSGFKQVDPEPFLRMCINDLSPIREAEQKMKICSTAAAYVERCRHQGVNLNMPKHCVRCERLNADHMESGDVVKITEDSPVRAADVVFIVEEKDCNKNVPAVLSKLAQSLDDGFTKAGYRQVHFAVVGFGGDGIHTEPHVVTSDSQTFSTVRNVDSALSNLATGKGDSNIFMALRYAAGLPFMTGSTKTFVLAKCSACMVEEMKADYSEMLRTMLDSDITLHLLMEHDFETRPPNKPEQAKKVLGFDKTLAYTVKDMKTNVPRGDRDLLAQLKIPKDLCVPLAMEVNGSFFSMDRIQDKRGANKKTIEVMSKRIMKSAKPAECQICECMETVRGIGKSVCQRCVSPIVAQLVSDAFSPAMNVIPGDAENEVM